MSTLIRSDAVLWRAQDPFRIFALPVTDDIAPQYSSIITNPMDLQTMGERLENGAYKEWDDLEADIELMCKNCLTYNPPDNRHYRQGLKMLKDAREIIRKARHGLIK